MQTTSGATNWQGSASSADARNYTNISREPQRKRLLEFVRHINDGLYARLQPVANLLARLLRPLNWLYKRWQFIRPVLFPAILVAAVVIGFTMEQGRDVLVATAAGTPKHGALFKPQPWWLLASLLIFSFTVWYFARLALDAAGHHCKGGKTSNVVRGLPGVLGMAPLAAATAVFFFNQQARGCLYLAVVCGALTVLAPFLASGSASFVTPSTTSGRSCRPSSRRSWCWSAPPCWSW